MENNQQLGRLEGAIASLLDAFNKVKDEKATLQADLIARDREIVELKETVANLQDEKSVVHEKVNTIIESLENWEKAQVAVGETQPESPVIESSLPEAAGNNGDSQQHIFSMDG